MKKTVKRIVKFNFTMLSQFLAFKHELEARFKKVVILFKGKNAAEFEISL